MRILTAGAAAIFALAATAAWASVEGASPTGFTAIESAHIAAPPGRVWAAMIQPARWWSSDHTFSHDAANLSLDPRAGGCWCETLPGGGSVEHLRVVYALPGKMLRMTGALGPLQSLPAQGVLTFTLAPARDGTEVKLTYALNGPASLGDLAVPVDRVLGEQLAGLKAVVETGRR